MLKLLNTLVRGTVAEFEETVFDANAIRLLEQQIREAATSLEHARRELACAMAHQSSENRAVTALTARIVELETSGVAALHDGAEALASEVATVIAATEDERRERREAVHRFDADIVRLRQLADEDRRRLTDLRRGLELARAQEALYRAGASGRRAIASGTGAIREAESTLARIRERQAGSRDVDAALDALEREAASKGLDERLAKAGYGAHPATKPDSVLERMRQTAKAQPAPKPTPSAG
jgi:phage shock protein A